MTLTDGREQLPNEHYRIATFEVASPGDVDGDGVDDLTELADPVYANPFNAAPRLDLTNGAVITPTKRRSPRCRIKATTSQETRTSRGSSS